MEKNVQATAIQLAVLIFFAMAIASWFFGCSPGACAARAFGGAVVMYAVVKIAGRMVVKILIDAIADSQMKKQTSKDSE